MLHDQYTGVHQSFYYLAVSGTGNFWKLLTGDISIPTSSGIVSEDETLGTNPASEIKLSVIKI